MRAGTSAAVPDRRWPRFALSPRRGAGATGAQAKHGRGGACSRERGTPRSRMTSGAAPRRADDDGAPPLLAVSQLTKHFPIKRGLFGREAGSVRAVDGVSLAVGRGETL